MWVCRINQYNTVFSCACCSNGAVRYPGEPPQKKTWVKNGQEWSMWRWGTFELEIKQLGTAYICLLLSVKRKLSMNGLLVNDWRCWPWAVCHLPRWISVWSFACWIEKSPPRPATSSPCNSQRPCKSRPEVSTGWKTKLDGHFLIESGMCPRNLTCLRLPHLGWNEKSLTWPDYVQGPRA